MIGPTIPDHLLKKRHHNEAEIPISLSGDEDTDPMMGPQLPTDSLKNKQVETMNNTDEINHSKDEQDTDQSIGPQIPIELLAKRQTTHNADEISISDDDIEFQTDQHSIEDKKKVVEQQMSSVEKIETVGPHIPQDILNKSKMENRNSDEEAETDSDDYAPALPPDLLEERRKQQQQQQQPTSRRRRPVGPSLPPSTSFSALQDNDDDFVIGPTLPRNYNPEEESKYSAIQAIEERARQSKEALEAKKEAESSTKIERPEWMLVPPEVDYLKNANSLRSRQFSNKSVSQIDNSSWTETPSDRQNSLNGQGSGKTKKPQTEESYVNRQAEMEMRRNIEAYNKHERPMSLLEMHQLKKRKKVSSADDVRNRPFDREKDLLGSRKLDRKQKKELFKQTTQLGQNFGYGSKSFL
ncbi:uncharacterized protein BX663DRAFT_516440 [Cokeromyces recurvatus]|uniref:uncharacterized protein n=1 Tax=Cokeromyces recurvatus TaxID=90255 RepID=UPI0022212142|nr:uncharacterized protein BX663DRAFT_516440 [Cokeromyces recurvatus]KAI7900763.1 hypothetical protein BX663DRAFT_516440 [Cokeromyces recurvatus]